MDERTNEPVAKSTPEMKRLLQDAGLFIKSRDDSFIKVSIPEDCIAFQIGEAAQIASNGKLVATPHLVRGVCQEHLARNTFAVFMQVRRILNH